MKKSSPIPKLDAHELRILDQLQIDCRASNQDLADQVHLSASACWRRVRALEDRGVIRAYVAMVDAERVGLDECVFAHVRLEKHSREITEQFVEAVMSRPEILGCYATTGDEDYMLRVLAPNTRSYQAFLEEFLLELPYIAHVKSHFTLRKIKEETRIPTKIFPRER